MNYWQDKKVCITGGSFIGSHLADRLIKLGVKYIRVANLTRRNKKYFSAYIKKDLLDFYQVDLRNLENAKVAVDDIDIVFHLAADHGGRGYVDTHQGATASNFLLDGSVFWACKEAGVEKVVYASSGCVYPNYLQTDPSKTIYLKESDMANCSQDADNMYGWCLTGSSLIITKDGLKEIQYVNSNDYVLSKDGQWHKVLRQLRKPINNKNFIKLKPSRGPTITLTPGHLVWTSIGWIKAEDIIGYRSGKKPFYTLPEPTPPHEILKKNYLNFKYHGYRSKILLNSDFYRFVGFWVADGTLEAWTGKNAQPGYMSIGQKNYKTLEKYLRIVKKWDPDAKINGPHKNGMHTLRLWHHGFWKWLRKEFTIGVRKKKTAPLWLSGLSKKQFEAFWDGWEEGDGLHDNRCPAVGTSSSALAGRMYCVLRARGIKTSLSMCCNDRFRSFKVRRLKVDYSNYGTVNNVNRHDYGNFLYDLEVKDADNFAVPGCFVHNSKLMGEMTLNHYYHDFGLKSVSLRYFTVYGSRAEENHAIMAMIARAFIGQNPFEVWGTGEAIRNWTHVNDIVSGTLLAAEKIDNAIPINLGTMERIRVIDAAKYILEYTKHNAEIKALADKPTGPYNRVADNALAKTLLGWEPKVKFIDGLYHTIDWYYKTKDKNKIRSNLNKLLGEK